MNHAEFVTARVMLGWSRHRIADVLQCDEDMIRLMEIGQRLIPLSVAQWLWDLVDYHTKHPPPPNWQWE
jgi:ribosome-binding protein aMBF1 (putative translation factor)